MAETVVVDGSRFAVPGPNAYNPFGFSPIYQPDPTTPVSASSLRCENCGAPGQPPTCRYCKVRRHG